MPETAIILSVEDLGNESEERRDELRYRSGVLNERCHQNEAILFKVKIALIFKIMNQSSDDIFKSTKQPIEHCLILSSNPNDIPAFIDDIFVSVFSLVDLDLNTVTNDVEYFID